MTFKKLIFLLLMAALICPLIQSKFNFINVTPLKGSIKSPENAYFSIKGWLSGDYQTKKEKYLNESFGFRNIFVRINNQIAFNLFNKAKANGVIIGKNNFLFEENYIKAYYGTDFIGVDSIWHRMQRLKYIQDTLKKLNKDLIIIFAAGKGSFYPEYIPDKYKKNIDKTNYGYHLKYAEELNLHYLDFNGYFIKNKHKSKYLLYPQYGIHWSYYGTCLVADSIIRYIESLRHINMPKLYWKEINMEYPKDAKEGDYDVADGMNLKFKLKSEKMAYPKLQFESDSGKTKPSVLVVSDSYYWGMFNFGISRSFNNSHFWYYNRQIYPDYYNNSLETGSINIRDEINRHDVIIIMATDANLPGFGWGFIENVYNMFSGKNNKNIHDSAFMKKVKNLINYIKTDEKWYKAVQEKAKNKNIPVDSMLMVDAMWQIKQDELKR